MGFTAQDNSRPRIARVHDYLLGGLDYNPEDRAEAGRLLAICPDLRGMARDSRRFLARAVTWAAAQGVTQVVDLGAGLPMPSCTSAADALPDLHDLAPDIRCAYVDADPLVTSHRRSATRGVSRVAVVGADLTQPPQVLADPGLRGVIDPAAPLAVIAGLVLSYLPAALAREVVAGYSRLIAPGSVVAVSCWDFADEGVWKGLAAALTCADLQNHGPSDIASFADGLELVPPGIVPAAGLRPGWADAPAGPSGPACVLAGVARKLRATTDSLLQARVQMTRGPYPCRVLTRSRR